MKNYLREQIKSMANKNFKQNYKNYATISNLNFIELCMKYLKALIPYMHLPNLYDNFYECLQLIFQLIGEGNEENINIILEENFIGIANQILNLRQFLDSDPKTNNGCCHKTSNKSHSDVFNIIIKNFEIILKVSNENSWLENADYILEKAHLYEHDDENIKYINQHGTKKQQIKDLIVSETKNKSYFGLRPYSDFKDVDKLRANFRISKLKVSVLRILLLFLNWKDPRSIDIMQKVHQLSVKLDPKVLRLNF